MACGASFPSNIRDKCNGLAAVVGEERIMSAVSHTMSYAETALQYGYIESIRIRSNALYLCVRL